LRPKRDRRVSGTDDAAEPENRVLRYGSANRLADKVQTCAHPARVLAALVLGVSCTVSPSTWAQVGRPPIITEHPKSQVAEIGSSASFSVEIISATPAKYQWQVRPQGTDRFTDLLNETNGTLIIPSVQLKDLGSYLVIVSNTAGSVTSEPAELSLPIKVTSLDDDGPGSLRDAIAKAADGGVINFSIHGTITLNSGELVIYKALTIVGPESGGVIISGGDSNRVFTL